MISAENVEKASDLLIDRAEIAESLANMLKAKKVRISYEITRTYAHSATEERESTHFVNGPTVPINAAISKLLTDGIKQQIAKIDAELRALGVEPPKETV